MTQVSKEGQFGFTLPQMVAAPQLVGPPWLSVRVSSVTAAMLSGVCWFYDKGQGAGFGKSPLCLLTHSSRPSSNVFSVKLSWVLPPFLRVAPIPPPF